jgi:ABC-type lipoprotein export system ATPase subunit
MIESLMIRNYRSCIETSMELQPDLSVLIGPNGSGKTNVLNAFLLLRKLAYESHSSFGSRGDSESIDKCELKVRFTSGSKAAILTSRILLDTDERNIDSVVGSTHSWYVRDFTGTSERLHIPLGAVRELRERPALIYRYLHVPRQVQIGRPPLFPPSFAPYAYRFANLAAEIQYYRASQFTNPSDCPVSVEIDKTGPSRRTWRQTPHTKFLYDLYSEYSGANKSNYNRFVDLIGPNGIGLIDELSFQEILTSSTEFSVRVGGRVRPKKRDKMLVIPQFLVGTNRLSPSQLSEGTFKTLTLLFYLMTERSSILLVEEPEVCVHQGLLSSIVELIKTYSRQKQIVISTHSDFVLDQLEPRHIYQVARDRRMGTVVTHLNTSLSVEDRAALKRFLETEGNLGEYYRHGGLRKESFDRRNRRRRQRRGRAS